MNASVSSATNPYSFTFRATRTGTSLPWLNDAADSSQPSRLLSAFGEHQANSAPREAAFMLDGGSSVIRLPFVTLMHPRSFVHPSESAITTAEARTDEGHRALLSVGRNDFAGVGPYIDFIV